MKRYASVILIGLMLVFPVSSYAIGWKALLDAVLKMYGVNLETRDINADQLSRLNELQGTLTGNHSYGQASYDSDAYSWGNSTSSWQQVLALSRNGGGNGQLGETILSLSKDYPIQNNFNSPNKTESDYYRLQAQTSLASRSAAEVSYQQAVDQEKRMRALHDMIDQVEDEKSASDLNNRLSSEQTMTSLQQTKLLSILVQQQAVSAQEKANRAKEDMEFFEK